MNQDAMLRDLAAERIEDLLPLLRRAFETGYREGMAAAGTVPPPAPSRLEPEVDPLAVTTPALVVAAPAEPKPVAAPEPDPIAEEADGADEVVEDDELVEVTSPGEGQPARKRFRGVRASATVGGLLRKIEQVFRVEERFDLVVRVEHPGSGRAPKRGMRLSAYLKEG